MNPTVTNADTLSTKTLEETVDKARTFLLAIGKNAAIRALMHANGYSNELQIHGWNLNIRASSDGIEALAPSSSSVVQALAAVEAWNELGYHKIHAALANRFPEQTAYLFGGISAGKGATALVAADTVLRRVDAMRKGDDPSRAAFKESDKAALDLLAQRGVTPEVLEELRAHVEAAKSAPEVPAPTDAEARHLADLKAMRAWYEEWSEIARAAIHDHAMLVRLGLAAHHRRRDADLEQATTPGVAPPAVPAPVTGSPAAATPVATAGGSTPAS